MKAGDISLGPRVKPEDDGYVNSEDDGWEKNLKNLKSL